MNKRSDSSISKRAYKSRLREEQAEQTRARILDAVEELLAGSGSQKLSIPKVAAKAGVSTPTIYRHFRDRETLLDAIEQRVQKVLAPPPSPESIGDLPVFALALFEAFGENAELLRAGLEAGTIKDVRERARVRRKRRFEKLVVDELEQLPGRQAHMVFAVIRHLLSADSWNQLTDDFGLSHGEAGRAVSWAIGALVTDARERDGPLVDRASIKTARDLRKAGAWAGQRPGDQNEEEET